MTKHFIAPLPPTRPKVYDVDALNFKKVVHALTSTPEFLYSSSSNHTHRRHLKDIAPPPLVLSTLPKQSLFPTQPPVVEFSTTTEEEKSNHDPLLPEFYSCLKNETLLGSDTTFGSKSSLVHDDDENEMDYLGSSVGFSYDDPYSHPTMSSPLRFSMSPNSLSWCYSGLLSPGTLSAVL
uniref:uncharacterized protein LOC122588160 n=1 Tax=Erigeron canadensis TaxID=72917 RepID=UPI001CB91496|nr:uncharacterized protein LOC122588160 [Erigeron canadensis]